jgi:hypothetical protein
MLFPQLVTLEVNSLIGAVHLLMACGMCGVRAYLVTRVTWFRLTSVFTVPDNIYKVT